MPRSCSVIITLSCFQFHFEEVDLLRMIPLRVSGRSESKSSCFSASVNAAVCLQSHKLVFFESAEPTIESRQSVCNKTEQPQQVDQTEL